jgi:hypothetical protein
MIETDAQLAQCGGLPEEDPRKSVKLLNAAGWGRRPEEKGRRVEMLRSQPEFVGVRPKLSQGRADDKENAGERAL